MNEEFEFFCYRTGTIEEGPIKMDLEIADRMRDSQTKTVGILYVQARDGSEQLSVEPAPNFERAAHSYWAKHGGIIAGAYNALHDKRRRTKKSTPHKKQTKPLNNTWRINQRKTGGIEDGQRTNISI